MLKLYTDAAVRGNPGPATGGALIIQAHKQIQLKTYLGTMNNHEAEFRAAIWAFTYLTENFSTDEVVAFYADSKLLIDSLTKHYAKHFASVLKQLLVLQSQFTLVLNEWIPERANSGAHSLALSELQNY
ncbi:ribonuclease HI family protein [Agrilactobacillus fermenti]|uniref:ribonuclease HI family protein n=1 Tax=Agrilactobacillus fermenti TaxID=2586909 RepID=UPI003A5BCB93